MERRLRTRLASKESHESQISRPDSAKACILNAAGCNDCIPIAPDDRESFRGMGAVSRTVGGRASRRNGQRHGRSCALHAPASRQLGERYRRDRRSLRHRRKPPIRISPSGHRDREVLARKRLISSRHRDLAAVPATPTGFSEVASSRSSRNRTPYPQASFAPLPARPAGISRCCPEAQPCARSGD